MLEWSPPGTIYVEGILDYQRLGRAALMVSELHLGCMTFGQELDGEGSRGIISRYLEAGGNFIVTADVYENGASEEITGRTLKGVPPDIYPYGFIRNTQGV